jgi:hypothetical protein
MPTTTRLIPASSDPPCWLCGGPGQLMMSGCLYCQACEVEWGAVPCRRGIMTDTDLRKLGEQHKGDRGFYIVPGIRKAACP